ncbi:MAG: TylF/MycF/NovP-related O-methyltransferase [Verrucomicrobiota bacterium]
MKPLKLDPGTDAYLELMKQVLAGSVYDESAWSVVEPVSDLSNQPKSPFRKVLNRFRALVITALRKKSFLLVRERRFDAAKREEGRDFPMVGYSMAGHRRLENVRFCVEEVLKNEVPGDFIETGAWRGGSTILMAALLKAYGETSRKVWVADSFEGLPVPKDETNRWDGWDLSGVDMLKVSLEKVRSNFARFGLLNDQVQFLKGWFCDTLPKAPIGELAILRLDGDLYSSTMDSLVNLYHKVSDGGYVIVDDYGSWPSCKQAVTEFLEKNNLHPEIIPIDWTGVYWKVKK